MFVRVVTALALLASASAQAGVKTLRDEVVKITKTEYVLEERVGIITIFLSLMSYF